MNKYTDGRVNRSVNWINGSMGGWMDGWKDESVDRLMEWMDGWKQGVREPGRDQMDT